MYEKYKGAILPSEDILKALLVREYGLSEEARRTYDLFIKSARYAGLLREGAQGLRLYSRDDILREEREIEREAIEVRERRPLEARIWKLAESDEFERLITDDFLFFTRKSPSAINIAKKMFTVWIESLEGKYCEE